MRTAKNKKKPSLCLDCANATNPDVCPWVRSAVQVPGWEATKTVIGKVHSFESYCVSYCPLFRRDAQDGGLKDDLFGERKRIRLDGNDVINLASAICTRAVEDWRYLKDGALKSVPYYGDRLHRDEILEFFFSKWFAMLLESFSDRTPEQIRGYLGITDDMKPEGGKRNRRSKT